MRVLVTGATGLVGKNLGIELVEAGHTVVVVTRAKDRAQLELPFPAEIHTWSGSGAVPKEALKNIDAVVNLMGENISARRWNPRQKSAIRKSRIDATCDLVRSFRDAGKFPATWIQASAIGYYGDSPSAKDESSPAGNDFMAEVCRDWEEATAKLPDTVRKIVIRIGVVLSHKGGVLERLVPLFLSGLGSALGNGHQKMSFIHLQDLTGFIHHALGTAKVEGIYNMVGDAPISNRDFTQALSRGLKVRQSPSVPSKVLKIVLGEMSQIVLADQPIVSRRLPESGYTLKYSTFAKMIDECLTWHQDPFDTKKTCCVLWREQWLPQPIPKVFPYFAAAENLERITPKFLNFKILSVSGPNVAKDTEINYRLKLYGVPMGWKTRIAEWVPDEYFVDNQEKGPYKRWYHEHRFKPLASGTLMQDWVRYRVPFGSVGLLVAGPLVRRNIEKIFEFRRKIAKVIA